jgi:hypothetical protein
MFFRKMAASRGRRDDPVPPPLPVPMCHCGIPAQVKQSRDEATAGRAFYTSVRKWILNEGGGPSQYNIAPCVFHQWIDGPKNFDPRIRLFPWLESVVQPYHEFKRWVPPPPNPLEMTFQEKQEVGCKCVSNPPLCHCGRPNKLQLLDLDLPDKFTPFFRCNQRTHVSIIALPDKFIVLDILTYRGLY